MQNNEKVKQSLQNLENALQRLKEALSQDHKDALQIDGTIQRFEFTVELFWKTLKRMLEQEGNNTSTPKDALKNAYRIGWLDNEDIWLQMLRDRNETSHIYDQNKAQQIYQNIKTYLLELERTFLFLKQRSS